MMKYTTIADDTDNIKLSAIWRFEDGKYTMPSLEIFRPGLAKAVFYADNELWIVETLLPALQRFQNRMMVTGDKEILSGVLDSFESIYDQLSAVPALIEVIQFSVTSGLLNVEQEQERSVATMPDSSNAA